jgi:apolipoprotein N-acyltransferase
MNPKPAANITKTLPSKPDPGRDAIPRDYLWAFFAAFIGMIAHPSSSLYPLGFIMVVPLLAAIEGKRNRSAFGIGYVFGAFYYMFLMWWSLPFSTPGVVAMTIVEAFSWAIWAISYVFLRRHTHLPIWAAAAIPWTAMELIRGSTELGVTWGWIAYTQWNFLPAIQIAEWIGAIGVGFLLVVANGLFWAMLAEPKWKGKLIRLGWLAGFLLLWLGTGALWVPEEEPNPPYTVVLCQGNIDHKRDDDRQREPMVYDLLSRQAAKYKPDLVVWPESASDANVGEYPHNLERVQRDVMTLNTDLVTGVDEDYWEGEEWRYYNSAAHFLQDGTLDGVYRKMMRVPFGEYIPLSLRSIGFLEHLIADASQYDRGYEFKVFTASQGFKFNILICWESTFGDLARQFVKDGSQLIVVITNDGWFGNSTAPYQHALICPFRAVENRSWVVRAANTGICEVVDPAGRVTAHTEIFRRTILPAKFGIRQTTTLYTMIGDLFGWIVVIVWVLLIVLTILREKLPKKWLGYLYKAN